MASIGREGTNGELKRLIYRDASGKQKSLRLGKCSERAAQNALAGFERVLEAHRIGSTIHPDGVRWLQALDDRLHARVVRLGLGAEPRKGATVVTLADLLDKFDAMSSVKDSTKAAYKQASDSLRAFLGDKTPLSSLTPARADEWRKAIAEPVTVKDEEGNEVVKRLASATVAKRTIIAKGIFRKAVRWGLMTTNPFADLRSGAQSNPERAFYVSPEVIRAVLDACPDDQWRGIIALSRFAALRCPSEVTALRWEDVNWERGRLLVRSVKTAHHEGHAVRVVPITVELRAILQDLYDQAPPQAEWVIPRLRDPSINLRTQFERIIAKAGEKSWPRLFHNLRASCLTDWAERLPAHAVAKMAGHSPIIAARHYLQVQDAHFDLLSGRGEVSANPATKAATQARTRPAAQKQANAKNPENQAVLVGCGVGCDPQENEGMGATGCELSSFSAEKSSISATGGNKSGNKGENLSHTSKESPEADPDLAAIIAAWPTLPVAMRAGLVAMVKAAAQ